MLQEENQICRLPPELLGQIFRHAVFPPSGPDNCRSSPDYRSLTSPYSISHVCRQWRDAALNYSLLWTLLSIMDPKNSELVNLLEVWIDRAGSLPLSFGLLVFKVKSKVATKAILRLFINSVHRCRDVTLDLVSLSPDLIDMENLSPQHPHLLQKATIAFEDKSNAKFDFLFNHIFSAPNLRSAQVFCENRISLPKVAPSWGNLQELTIDVFSPAQLISALAFCQNLKQLTIASPRTSGRRPTGPITLPQLTYLSVSMGMCPSFFDNLLVPSLKEVYIQNIEGPCWDHLIRLLERSAVMIRVLTLEWVGWCSEEPDILQSLGTSVFRRIRVLYVKYPAGMKTVEFLTLPSCSNCESSMQAHCDCGSNLPHLQKLELFLYKLDPEDMSVALLRLVESRLGTSDPETMSRCVNWESLVVEVKLSMEGPTFN